MPVIVVVCDDARTAVSYFDVLKRLVKEKLTLTVVPNPHDRASAAEVVELAQRRLAALRQDKASDRADQNSVWALVDLEGTDARQRAARAAKKIGKAGKINVALSNPCYEMWTLLHLADTGEAFVDCSAVLRRVEQEWQRKFNRPFGSKAQADYTKIIDDRMLAAVRARRHHEAKDPSWTEVYLLIEEIDRRRNNAPGA